MKDTWCVSHHHHRKIKSAVWNTEEDQVRVYWFDYGIIAPQQVVMMMSIVWRVSVEDLRIYTCIFTVTSKPKPKPNRLAKQCAWHCTEHGNPNGEC